MQEHLEEKSEVRVGKVAEKNQKSKSKTEEVFMIKEVLVRETFSCNYAPGCDCSAY